MPTPFKVEWSQPAVDKVLAQVRAYEFPVAPEGGGWNHGCDAETLKRLTAYWADGFDVAGAVDNLNRFPQFTARVEDLDLHYVHVVGEAQGKRPLLLTHGWPGSHFEFWDAIEPLAFPSRFGGDPADAFDLVIPSLPGFGFSGKPKAPIGQRATARLFNTLMTEVLGYDHYLAQGGDWGSVVTSWLGLDHAAHVKAIHLNMIGFRPHGPPDGGAEVAWIQRTAFAMDVMGAYLRLQVSKPQSLAWLGANNPVGQAAWILERFHDWADLTSKPFETVFSPDKLLTNIMIYVMTGSFTTGAWYYRGVMEEGGVTLPQGVRCETPTAYANFPGELLYSAPPRSWADRAYNIVRWTDMPRGGHFAAMEEPDLFVQDVREWGRES
jgi:pimeloyl-ACP methyl ester carboxylesterase